MAGFAQAPELPEGLEWVNSKETHTLEEMRGRVALLFFWSYSNVNSLNVLPDLRYLEGKYHDGLNVIGIHCPKFTVERNSAHVLKAVNRLQIKFPVASDPDFLAWQAFGVRAWPSVVVIDAAGRIMALVGGEDRRAELDQLIGKLLDEAAARDIRAFGQAPVANRSEAKMPLRFPGKLLATDSNLYIADSGHHRILETDLQGQIMRQFGSGNAGFWDGRILDAGFSNPQGLALIKDALYVADLGNNAIRRIRIGTGDVDTVVGNGAQARAMPGDNADPKSIGLNAPWDVAAVGDRLFIALAGQHQIWCYDTSTRRVSVFCGSGRYGLEDGDAESASFAKPVGLATGPGTLYVADADSSAVRAVSLADGSVKTLVGAGLYDFGDTDGMPAQVRLQHPMALATDSNGSILWLCDSFNGKLKALSLKGGGARTLRLQRRFQEPSGMSITPGALWVVDTNMHEVVRLDTRTGAVQHIAVGG